MQRIERYGVIALVFLLVTILAVSIWGEGQAQDVLASVKNKASGVLGGVAAADSDSEPTTELVPGGRRAAKRTLPMAGQEQPAPRKRGGRKGGLRRDESLEDAFVDLGPRTANKPVPTPESRMVVPARRPAAVTPPVAAPVVAAARPQPKPARAEARTGSRTYTVRSGDTMSEIAQRELGTYKRWSEIQSINGGLDPAKLRVGMEIKLPGGARAGRAVAPAKAAVPTPARTERVASTPKSSGSRYSVRKGDSLGMIAQRELGTASRWKEIVAHNPGIEPNRLAVGAKLVMPEGLGLPPVRTQQVASLTTSERSGAGRVR